MFHVKRLVRGPKIGLFRTQRGDHQLSLQGANLRNQGVGMPAVQFGRRIIQQQRRRAAPSTPHQPNHGQGQRRTEHFLLPAGKHFTGDPVVDFQLHVEAVMSRFPPEQRAYFESFPWWAVAFWAIGVFGGVIGCLLLLLKNRLAFHVLLASVIGATVCNLGGLFLLGGMEVMRETSDLGLTAFPIVVAAFLAYYARAMRQKGVLS